MISIIRMIQCGIMVRITHIIGLIGTLLTSWSQCRFSIHPQTLLSTMMKLNINNIFRLSRVTMPITILTIIHIHSIRHFHLQQNHVHKQII
jgi:hypothetical protein